MKQGYQIKGAEKKEGKVNTYAHVHTHIHVYIQTQTSPDLPNSSPLLRNDQNFHHVNKV